MTDKKYSIQKRTARKYLDRAKERRGTPMYLGALARARYEMARTIRAYQLLVK